MYMEYIDSEISFIYKEIIVIILHYIIMLFVISKLYALHI